MIFVLRCGATAEVSRWLAATLASIRQVGLPVDVWKKLQNSFLDCLDADLIPPKDHGALQKPG